MVILDLSYIEEVPQSESISGGSLVNLNINVSPQISTAVAVAVGVLNSGPVRAAAEALNRFNGRQKIRS
jgi:hypothetical protein